ALSTTTRARRFRPSRCRSRRSTEATTGWTLVPSS
ncbi:MAG: hypothetical protein AVDCRST_MAG55-1168, partial [uncultured Rubrobacteraceae bacterium]